MGGPRWWHIEVICSYEELACLVFHAKSGVLKTNVKQGSAQLQQQLLKSSLHLDVYRLSTDSTD